MLGARTTLLYVLSVATSAVGCGLLLDQVFSLLPTAAPQLAAHVHSMTHGMPGPSANLWAIALLGVLAFSCFSAWRGRARQAPEHEPHQQHDDHCCHEARVSL